MEMNKSVDLHAQLRNNYGKKRAKLASITQQTTVVNSHRLIQVRQQDAYIDKRGGAAGA